MIEQLTGGLPSSGKPLKLGKIIEMIVVRPWKENKQHRRYMIPEKRASAVSPVIIVPGCAGRRNWAGPERSVSWVMPGHTCAWEVVTVSAAAFAGAAPSFRRSHLGTQASLAPGERRLLDRPGRAEKQTWKGQAEPRGPEH